MGFSNNHVSIDISNTYIEEPGDGSSPVFLKCTLSRRCAKIPNLFVGSFRKDAPPDTWHTMTIWGSRYGRSPVGYTALLCLCAYRLTADPRFLAWARAAGRCTITEPFPTHIAVPAMDAGMGLGLLADLHDLTGEPDWLTGGLERADELTAIYFDRNDLPRGASGIDPYESQMGPGFLLHGLARLGLLSQHGRASCPLGPDYTGR